MGNTFGRMFKVTTWGESHGDAVGVTIDGCPPLVEIDLADIQYDLDRRKPGQSLITSQRRESDRAQILSGVFEDQSLGTPIHIIVHNEDQKSKDYEHMKDKFRPSHADFTYQSKYGIRNWKGGGRASARETIGRVAAGAIAKKILKNDYDVQIIGHVKQIWNIIADIDPSKVSKDGVESSSIRCPDPVSSEKMFNAIDKARKNRDSLGGIIELVVHNVPIGLGSPVFDKLDADLAKAMLSLPASKGFEIGSGFGGVSMSGSEHNDEFYTSEKGDVKTRTNYSGGIQGGISNGEDIIIRVAFKPPATIMKEQNTINENLEDVVLEGRGRHDPCVLPRSVPIVEAMTALVLMDHVLLQRGQVGHV